MSHPAPLVEDLRLAALNRYSVLDTPAEAGFDRFTALATRLFEVPIAVVSLVDRERLWFKSCAGLPANQVERDGAFCSYAIQQDEVFVVPDATLDARFAHASFVVGEPFLRFYAGAPLINAEGLRIGTFCLFGHVPRQFSPTQMADLRGLAAMVMDALEARRTTQQMAAEVAERQHAEAHKQAVLDAALDGIFTIDHHGVVIELNRAAETMFGYPAAQAVGRELTGLIIPPASREAHRCGMAHFLATGEGPALNKRLELSAVRADGREFPVELTITRIAAAGPPMFTGYIRDISARQAVENQLRMLESSVRHANDAIVITEAEPVEGDGPRIIYVNQAFTTATGYTSEEALGQTPRMLQGPDTSPEAKAKIRKALKRWKPVRVELLNYRKDGSEFWVELNIVPVANEKGWYTHWVSVQRDITERRRVQKQIEDHDHLLSSVIDGTDNIIFLKDRQSRYLLINPAGARILNRTPAEVIGKDDSAFFPPEETRQIQAYDQEVMRLDRPMTTESRDVINGVEHVFESTKSPYRDAAGNLLGVIGIVREVTAMRQAANALQQAKEEAERANLAKSEFLSRMSHELRTPMNAILGFAQLLELSVQTSRQHENVSHILKGGRHLLGLINEVLDIARIESGHMELTPGPVQVEDLVSATVSLLRPLADQYKVQIGHCHGSGCDRTLWADRQRLSQVLLNLLSNAVKYNRPGGSVSILCEPAAREGHLRLSVSDTGTGIDPANLGKLFTPFERLGAEKSRVEGTGIGLALSKRLVEAMEGCIGVESTLGEGTTFYFELPISTRSPRSEDLAPVRPEVVATAGPVVLCIEDNPSNIALVEQTLEVLRPNVRMLGAMDGRVGLDLARQRRPDLILLDLQLPDLAGDALLAQLQADQQTRDIPVIMVSADATNDQPKRLLDLGARAYLTKPLDIAVFLRAIDEALHAR